MLSAAALEAARALMPGQDVYALEADWRGLWDRIGPAAPAQPGRGVSGLGEEARRERGVEAGFPAQAR